MGKRLAAVLLIVLTCLPAFADTQGSSKAFPLPQAEVEQLISKALRLNDFEVTRTAIGMGKVRLDAASPHGDWQVLLTPDSPLATDVRVSFRPRSQAFPSPRPEDFWRLISTDTCPGLNGPKAPSPPVGSTDEKTIPSVILSRIEAVVCIKAGEESNPVQLSGVVVSPDGLILCTAHDLRNLQHVNVICYDGLVVGGNVVHADHRLDLAMVHVEREFEAFIDLADGRNLLGVGERLYSVGCPIDLGGTVYSGVVNAPPRQVEGLPLWQVDMEIHHGSSGSPVFDVRGTIVAVVKGRYRGTDSVGFLIPLETIMSFATHVDP